MHWLNNYTRRPYPKGTRMFTAFTTNVAPKALLMFAPLTIMVAGIEGNRHRYLIMILKEIRSISTIILN